MKDSNNLICDECVTSLTGATEHQNGKQKKKEAQLP